VMPLHAGQSLCLKPPFSSFLRMNLSLAKNNLSRSNQPLMVITERLRTNTYRSVALVVDKPALSNVWWPAKIKNVENQATFEKFLALWLNSTLGLLLLLSYRGDTEGSWVQLKKPSLEALPVPDVRKFSVSQVRMVDRLFKEVATKPLLTLPMVESDTTRRSIDEGLGKILGLLDISVLRQALSKEPIISVKAL
jgi:hypothetical protein